MVNIIRKNYKKLPILYHLLQNTTYSNFFLRKTTLYDPNACKTLPGDRIRLLTVKCWFDQIRFLHVMLLIALK